MKYTVNSPKPVVIELETKDGTHSIESGCGYFISLDQDDIRKCEMWIMRWRISAGVTPFFLKM